ncbi:ABC transporter ATP-binding protein [Lentilactobacillus sp. Marseille-Q4993]|uniref:ABC transporter ATP-binding protein n=1 Tax=Lentilactobacillus sp. Marseille-Q4993 TaxID=3039492 RepID=UPI0024BC01C6|nr:ABC transporter ATP-binding protein [Lentilactobacillus sp. Marseille-Q4993]
MTTQAVAIKNLKFSYGDKPVLKGVNLEIHEGEIFGLVGPNGAGKTTLLNSIMGLTSADQITGSVEVYGSTRISNQIKNMIGSMLQGDIRLTRVTVREYLSVIASQYYDPKPVEAVINELKLGSFANKWLTGISGGQLRRVTFAAAIIGQPKLLFLDEPTVGMDVDARREFWDYVDNLKMQGTTIMVTSHYLAEIQTVADRIGILIDGKFESVGTWNELSQVDSGGTIEFTTEISTSIFEDLPAVTGIQRSGMITTINSENTDDTLKSLVPFIEKLSEITVQRKSLESLFMGLTERE